MRLVIQVAKRKNRFTSKTKSVPEKEACFEDAPAVGNEKR